MEFIKRHRKLPLVYYNWFRGVFSKRLFFLHIPKCGGTSIDAAFQHNYFNSNIFHLFAEPSTKAAKHISEMYKQQNYITVEAFREAQLLYAMQETQYWYISGHFYFSQKCFNNFKKEFIYITILRDPVKRWISHYFYNKYKQSKHYKSDADIESILDPNKDNVRGTNLIRYLSGLPGDKTASIKQRLNIAKDNLSKFDIVGILENMDGFKRDVWEKTGIKLKVSRRNESPVPASLKEKVLTDKIVHQIEERCKHDMELYDYAVKLSKR